jgi:hypothetical protein
MPRIKKRKIIDSQLGKEIETLVAKTRKLRKNSPIQPADTQEALKKASIRRKR